MLIFFLLFLCHQTNGDGKVILPGGGVVGLGKDVVFKYETDEEWFMCTYYRYEPMEKQDEVLPSKTRRHWRHWRREIFSEIREKRGNSSKNGEKAAKTRKKRRKNIEKTGKFFHETGKY